MTHGDHTTVKALEIAYELAKREVGGGRIPTAKFVGRKAAEVLEGIESGVNTKEQI